MQPMFEDLLEHLRKPFQVDRGVKTDDSILLVYPPERELDFREELTDVFLPRLALEEIPHHTVDIADFLFECVDADELEDLSDDEFEGSPTMLRGLAKRVEVRLPRLLKELGERNEGANLIISGTAGLYPLVHFSESLKEFRDTRCRIALAFPGEERGGKLHFMNRPDGGNYLAVKLFWR